jgi:hypothetical protein
MYELEVQSGAQWFNVGKLHVEPGKSYRIWQQQDGDVMITAA